MKIDSIEPEAKKAAEESGLANNQTALLEIAGTPEFDQVAKVEEVASRRAEKKAKAVKEEAGGRAANPWRHRSRKDRQAWAQVVANELITRYGADVVRAQLRPATTTCS